MNRLQFLLFNALSVGAGFALLHCSDNSTPAATPTADSAPPAVDGSTAQDASEDLASNLQPIPTKRISHPEVYAIALQPQPIPDPRDAATPPFDPGFTIPLVLANHESYNPARKPDLYVDSKFVGGIGLGCFAYKFVPGNNPFDPHGPGLNHLDMGNVLVGGFSGNGVYDFPPMGGHPISNPVECQRKEIFPDAGLFNYQCATFGPANSPDGGSVFLNKDDTVTVSAEGGAAFKPWQLQGKPSPNDNLVVTTNLWGQQALDGSQDLKVEYNCGGGPCGFASTLFINIVSSNVRPAGPVTPETMTLFPGDDPSNPPPTEFGLINCVEFLNFAHNSFTIPKEVLAQIPNSWTDLRIVVATVNGANDQVDEQPTLLASGFARFGVSHR